MKFINPAILVKLHLVLAAFILPVAIAFLITGALYFLLEFDGNYNNTHHKITLAEPLSENQDDLLEITKQEIAKLGLTEPHPEAYKELGHLDEPPYYQFEWYDGIKRIIKLRPTADPLIGELIIEEASFYRKLMSLHTAQGNVFFRAYALLFATVLLLMFVTGYLMAWRLSPQRGLVISSTVASLALFSIIFLLQ